LLRRAVEHFGLGNGTAKLARTFVLLTALPLIVMIGSEFALFYFATQLRAATTGAFDGRTQAVSLIDMIAATTLLCSVCAGIVAFFVGDCSRRLKREAYSEMLRWWLGLSMLCYLLLFILPLHWSQTRSWRLLGLAPEVCPASRVAGNLETGACGTALVDWLLDLSTPLLVLASVAAVLGAISTLATSGPGTTQPVAEWKMQRQAADAWLLIGSGLLIAGLVFHHSWGRWLAANWGLSDSKEFSALVAAYTSFKGVQSSVLIAAYYIPIVCVFAMRADTIAMARVQNPDRVEKYKERHGLNFPVGAIIKNIGGILAPFVASMLGPISDLIKSVG
jgi:hypothetical protein